MKTIFSFDGYARQGYRVIGAGICCEKDKKRISEAFEDLSVMDIEVSDLNNPFLVDIALAENIKKLTPAGVLAVGASMLIPGAVGPTGGILGNPFKEASSASGLGECIGNGLSVAAHPGGPGIIMKGDSGLAEEILLLVQREQGSLRSIETLVDGLHARGVKLAIIVTDGSGSIHPGRVVVYENGKTDILAIDSH